MSVSRHNSLTPKSTNCVRPNIYLGRRQQHVSFNRDRFELLNFGKSARTFHYEAPQGKQIEAKEGVRDLEITFEPNGKFDKHITSVVAQGGYMVGGILQTFRTIRKGVVLTLLKTFIVPQVEY